MHKNGKPTTPEPAAQPKNPEKAFAPHLAEERGGLTKVMRDLMCLRRTLDGSGELSPEDQLVALKQVLDGLKSHGFAKPDAEINIPHVLGKCIDNAMMETMGQVNFGEMHSFLLKDANLSETGTRIFTSRNTALIITDPDGQEERGETIAKVVQVVRKALGWINSPSIYTAHMDIQGGLVGMQIDHGKHKGYLGVFCPEGEQEAVVYFKHIEHGQGQFSGNRVAFVKKALEAYGLPQSVARRGGGSCDVRTIRTVKLENLGPVLETAVRLSRAVKDLDMTLSSSQHAALAAMLFSAGATNMVEFLTYLKTRQRPSDSPDRHFNLAEYEKKLLERFIGEAGELERWADGIWERHALIREAKDLNFIVLRQCTELQLAILGYTKQGQPVPKREVERRFTAICCDLVRMARVCDGNRDSDSPSWYEQKAKALVEKYDRVISVCGWSLDESETGQVMGMFGDRGGELELDKVNSIEELVRLMHSKTILPRTGMQYDSTARDESGKLVLLDCFAPLPAGFVCLNLEKDVEAEELETYEILRKLLSSLSRLEEAKSVAIVGSDFADISMPEGKHYVELSADLDDKNECYALRLRYFETRYYNAEKRSAYVMGMLGALGFSATRTGNFTDAAMRTQDRKKWATAYREAVRLMLSVKNLDVTNAEPEHMASLFLSGFTDLNRCMHTHRDMVRSVDEERASIYRKILSNSSFCDGDKTAFTRCFAELLGHKPSRIMPLLNGFTAEELDRVYEHLYDIEFAAKEAGDTRTARKVVTLENKLEKLIGEKLPPKRDV